jgi:hypothetical protein
MTVRAKGGAELALSRCTAGKFCNVQGSERLAEPA